MNYLLLICSDGVSSSEKSAAMQREMLGCRLAGCRGLP